MNKDFLEKLTERKNTFQLLDLSVDDSKHNKDNEKDKDNDKDKESKDDESKDEDFEKVDKSRYKPDQFTKYLQYITASD